MSSITVVLKSISFGFEVGFNSCVLGAVLELMVKVHVSPNQQKVD